MKTRFWILTVMLWAALSSAQTNNAVQLAIVPETPEAAPLADLLTVQFSPKEGVHLLERTDIAKVYAEQSLAAGNRDYIKLGRLLGADGLLIVEHLPSTNNSPLPFSPAGEMPRIYRLRLIAVKPGVVLTAVTFGTVSKNLADSASSLAQHLELLLPKLAVSAQDALPLSVVNLRSAVSSAEAAELERQLKALTIERLSREPQLFVLERQRMELLAEEKDLAADESAFWNGAYLLEGVVDKNGYSKDTLTVDARLTPKGGAPILFAIAGSRTNLAEVVNQLALRVTDALKVNPSSREWSPADEAAQYFAEGQWALRWGVLPEAQMAAEAAWTLGKQDLPCAQLRIRAYVQAVSGAVPDFQVGEMSFSRGFDAAGNPVSPMPSEASMRADVARELARHRFGMVTKVINETNSREVDYVTSGTAPQVENIDRAIRALELYAAFSRSSTDGVPAVLWRGRGWNDWHASEWYKLGIDDLVAASRVLQQFNLMPEDRRNATDQLAELRRLARAVAAMIAAAPTVHDSYFVGTRIAESDELTHTMEESENIFRCEVEWGAYWQERPEDSLAQYRELMSSPVFCYIHTAFWQPKAPAAHLVAWDEADQQRLPELWKRFVAELNASPNVLMRMEAKALARADATSETEAHAAEGEWWSLVRSNREELVANNVDLFYLGWHFAYDPETQAMDQEYWNKEIPAFQAAKALEAQKHYLASFTPYDWKTFNGVFEARNYTRAQAAELKPLIVAYKSNLLAQPGEQTAFGRTSRDANILWIETYLESRVDSILNPAPPQATRVVVTVPAKLPPVAKPPARQSSANAEVVTNVLPVTRFLAIPLAGLPGDRIGDVTITAHHWIEGRLVLDFQYGACVYESDEQGNWRSTRNVVYTAIAVLDPGNGHWQVVGCPERDILHQNHFYHRTTLCRGGLFTSDGGKIRRYSAANQAWQVLDTPDVGNCELFSVAGHLYAATTDSIMEILDSEQRVRILASNRRQPPASTLDAEDLGTPVLFTGPAGGLRAAIAKRVVAWDGSDWRPVCPMPTALPAPDICDDGVLFCSRDLNESPSIWHIATGGNKVACYLIQPNPRFSPLGAGISPDWKPVWTLPPDYFLLGNVSAAARGPNLYLLADHAESKDIVDEQQHLVIGRDVRPRDGYQARLFCFDPADRRPQSVFLRFDAPQALPPVAGTGRTPWWITIPGAPKPRLWFSDQFLFCARETADALPTASPGAGELQTGVWLIPLSVLDTEISRQKAIQREQEVAAEVATKKAAETLLQKYDRNHNGIIDPDEREEALDDPAFISQQVSQIDTNHNGWLDASELAWFDANQNRILDPKEQAGIRLAVHAFAESLLARFDQNGDGVLDMQEYHNLMENAPSEKATLPFNVQFMHADENHDGRIDVKEIENLLMANLRLPFLRPWMHGPAFRPGRGQADTDTDFKACVEAYWRGERSSIPGPHSHSFSPPLLMPASPP